MIVLFNRCYIMHDLMKFSWFYVNGSNIQILHDVIVARIRGVIELWCACTDLGLKVNAKSQLGKSTLPKQGPYPLSHILKFLKHLKIFGNENIFLSSSNFTCVYILITRRSSTPAQRWLIISFCLYGIENVLKWPFYNIINRSMHVYII